MNIGIAVYRQMKNIIMKPMGKIIAIGGGEIGRPGRPIETTEIDKEIVRISKKARPRLLFLPTASNDSEGYVKTVKKHFGDDLGCRVSALYLIKSPPSYKEIEERILAADIIYVGGGNTEAMLKIWRKTGTEKALQKAYEKGVVLSGLSAGAVCWFSHGVSDSKKFTNPNAGFTKITGMGLISALYCPHYDVEKDRKPALKKMMKKISGAAVAIDNCCALEIIDDKYRVISSKPSANAYKAYWSSGKFYEELIEKTNRFTSLAELLSQKRKG
ncbi:MAG: Type 1 glutamine amidotransferase-like domain-containing protein [bacterium]|nr:Type 1 glutamine amidotransferase-like domain-containing protein [bacterium]